MHRRAEGIMNIRLLASCAIFMSIAWVARVPAQGGAPAPLPAEVQNPGFEAGEPGQTPPGWSALPGTARAQTSDQNAIEGRACVVLSRASDADGTFVNLMQSIDAAPYRGKRVELCASVRFSGSGQAQMWFRVDRPDGAPGFFDNMADRPIRGEAWASFSIRGDVEDDAAAIALGFFLVNGPGRAWIDGVSLRVLGPAGAGSIAPAPLTARGTESLVALARLLGVVRHFHPSTESGAFDWDSFTIRAVQGVESATSAAELAEALAAWMAPVAPSVRVWAGQRDIVPTTPGKPESATHLVGMKYKGYALPEAPGERRGPEFNVYSAKRVREPIARDDLKREIPPPGTAVTLDLGGGVCAVVPISLYADAAGRTMPEATGIEPQTPARPHDWSASAKDRATRLAAVCLGWGALRHFYPYFDVTPDDWDAALAPALSRAAQDSGAEEFHRTLSLMLAHLHDGHGFVGGPGQPARAPRDFSWGWVGDELVVSGVGTTQATLIAGDVILAIDGRKVADLYTEAAPSICASTEGWRRARATSELGWTAGPGVVNLLVRRDGREMRITVPRIGAVKYFKPAHPADGSEVAPGIVYFNLDGAETAALMGVWAKLLEARGVIFDLRGYPGSAGAALLPYLSDRALESAKWTVPVLTMPNFENVTFDKSNWNLPPQQPRFTGEVAFLTGGGAISYAESCMGIVEAYKLGEIVGANTAGSNGNVTAVKLPAGYSLSFTGMKVLKHDGSRHHGVGIKPTVPVEPTVEGLAAGRDEVLERAVEVLQVKIEKHAEQRGAPGAK